MAMDGTIAVRIQMEVLMGKKPARKDTEEEATFRRTVSIEIAAMETAGLVVDIPSI